MQPCRTCSWETSGSWPEVGEGEVPNEPRLLIDCSYIDFTRQPTGIPRVVLKYVEVGYEWGRRRGVQVIPVVPTRTGVYVHRPLPGREPPKALQEMVEKSESPGPVWRISEKLALLGWIYVRDVLHHFWFLIASIIRVRPVRRLAEMLDRGANRLFGLPYRLFERARQRAATIVPQPGDVMLCPAYWHDVDPEIYRGLKRAGVKVVILVHDILPVTHAEYYVSPWRDRFRDNLRAAFSYATAFLTVSSYTRQGLIEFGVRNKQPIPPAVTAYNGYEPLVASPEGQALLEAPSSRADVNKRFLGQVAPLIMVGSIEPKKGHVGVIDELEALWREGYQRDLVIIGRRGWMEDEIVRRITSSSFYGEKLFWFSDLDDFDLAYAYKHAHALVFASISEGFGIPMIEAALLGCPAVVLDTPIAREVLGDNGVFWGDGVTLTERLRELEQPRALEAARARAAQVAWPSWDAYTPKVLDALMELAAGKPPTSPVVPR